MRDREIKNYKRKKKNIWILGLTSSAVFGYLAFASFDWNTLKLTISSVDPVPFLLSGIFIGFSFILRAFRWNFFLPQNGSFSFHSLLSGVAIGYFFSNIFPVRVGDFIRPAYLAKANREPYQICLYSIVIERVWELVILLIIAVIMLKFIYRDYIGMLNISFPVLFTLIVFGILFLIFARQILNFLFHVTKFFKINFLSNLIKDIACAFEGNFKLSRLALAFLLTVIIFFLEGLFFVFILESLDLPITFMGKFAVMVITSLAHLFPSAPAGIGVFHYFCQSSIVMFGVSGDVAISAAILIHAYIVVFDFIFGIACIVFGPLRISDVLKNESIAG